MVKTSRGKIYVRYNFIYDSIIKVPLLIDHFLLELLQLLEYFKPSEHWIPNSSMHKWAGKMPNLLSTEELEDELFKLFLETLF